jgi:hypothetical protein
VTARMVLSLFQKAANYFLLEYGISLIFKRVRTWKQEDKLPK